MKSKVKAADSRAHARNLSLCSWTFSFAPFFLLLTLSLQRSSTSFAFYLRDSTQPSKQTLAPRVQHKISFVFQSRTTNSTTAPRRVSIQIAANLQLTRLVDCLVSSSPQESFVFILDFTTVNVSFIAASQLPIRIFNQADSIWEPQEFLLIKLRWVDCSSSALRTNTNGYRIPWSRSIPRPT